MECERCGNDRAFDEIGCEGIWTEMRCPCCGYHFVTAARMFRSASELYQRIGMRNGH